MSKTFKTTRLSLSWSTSRGRDTYGYNIARLDDSDTDQRFKCMGGGYDMVGTVFGDWLEARYQDRLKALHHRAHAHVVGGNRTDGTNPEKLYGMTAHYVGVHSPGGLVRVSLDGGCGIESMIHIAEAIGLEVQATYTRGRRAQRDGFIVSEEVEAGHYTKGA